MIVTRECVKPEPFKPVHIELETQEELNALWHILTVGGNDNRCNYMRAKGLNQSGPIFKMWKVLWRKLNEQGGANSG